MPEWHQERLSLVNNQSYLLLWSVHFWSGVIAPTVLRVETLDQRHVEVETVHEYSKLTKHHKDDIHVASDPSQYRIQRQDRK